MRRSRLHFVVGNSLFSDKRVSMFDSRREKKKKTQSINEIAAVVCVCFLISLI